MSAASRPIANEEDSGGTSLPLDLDAREVQAQFQAEQRRQSRYLQSQEAQRKNVALMEECKVAWKAQFDERLAKMIDLVSGDAHRTPADIATIVHAVADLDARQRQLRGLNNSVFLVQNNLRLGEALVDLIHSVASYNPNAFDPDRHPQAFRRCRNDEDVPQSCFSGLYLRRAHVTRRELDEFARNRPGAARAFHDTRGYLLQCDPDSKDGFHLYYVGTTHASTPSGREDSDEGVDIDGHSLMLNFLRDVLKGRRMDVYEIITGVQDPCGHDSIEWRRNEDCQESERILISLFRGIGLNSAPGGFSFPGVRTDEEITVQHAALDLAAAQGEITYSISEEERRARVKHLQDNIRGFHDLKKRMFNNHPSVAKLGDRKVIGKIATEQAFNDVLDNVARCDFLSGILAKDITLEKATLESLLDTDAKMGYVRDTCGPAALMAQLASRWIDGEEEQPLTQHRLFSDVWRDIEKHIIIIYVILEELCVLRISGVKTLSIESSRVFALFDTGLVARVHEDAVQSGLMDRLLANDFGEWVIDEIAALQFRIIRIVIRWFRYYTRHWQTLRVGQCSVLRLRDKEGKVIFDCVVIPTIHPGSIKYEPDLSVMKARAFYYCRVTLKIAELLAARGKTPEEIVETVVKIKKLSGLDKVESDNRKKLVSLTEMFNLLRRMHSQDSDADATAEAAELAQLGNDEVVAEYSLDEAEAEAEESALECAEKLKQEKLELSEMMSVAVCYANEMHLKAQGEPNSPERTEWCKSLIKVGHTEIGAQLVPCPPMIQPNTQLHLDWAISQPKLNANMVRSAFGTMSLMIHPDAPRKHSHAPNRARSYATDDHIRGSGETEMQGSLHTMIKNTTYRARPHGWHYDKKASEARPANKSAAAAPSTDGKRQIKQVNEVILPALDGDLFDTVLKEGTRHLYRIANCATCNKLTMGPEAHCHCKKAPLSKSHPNFHVEIYSDHQALHALGINPHEYMEMRREDGQTDDYEVLPIAPILQDWEVWKVYLKHNKITWQGGFETNYFEGVAPYFSTGEGIFPRDATVHERRISALIWTFVHRDPKHVYSDGQLAVMQSSFRNATAMVPVLSGENQGKCLAEAVCAGNATDPAHPCGKHMIASIDEDKIKYRRSNPSAPDSTKKVNHQHSHLKRSEEGNIKPAKGPLGTSELVVHQRPALQGVRSWFRLGATYPEAWPPIKASSDRQHVKVQKWRDARLSKLDRLATHPNTAMPVADDSFVIAKGQKKNDCRTVQVLRVIDTMDDLPPLTAIAAILFQQRLSAYPSHPVYLYGVPCDLQDPLIAPPAPLLLPSDVRNIRTKLRRASRDFDTLFRPHLDDLARILRVDLDLTNGKETFAPTAPLMRLSFLAERGMFTTQERYDLRDSKEDNHVTIWELRDWMKRRQTALLERREVLIDEGKLERKVAYQDVDPAITPAFNDAYERLIKDKFSLQPSLSTGSSAPASTRTTELQVAGPSSESRKLLSAKRALDADEALAQGSSSTLANADSARDDGRSMKRKRNV